MNNEYPDKEHFHNFSISTNYFLDPPMGARNLRPPSVKPGIDLILHHHNNTTTTIDLKVDSYYGSDPDRKIRGLCNPDSGFILLETISQLQFDRRDKSTPTAP